MMEQIMAAQEEALRAKRVEREVAARKAEKDFGKGGGFKAGFFGNGKDKDKTSSGAKGNTNKGKAQAAEPEKEHIPTIRANKAAARAEKAAGITRVNEEVRVCVYICHVSWIKHCMSLVCLRPLR